VASLRDVNRDTVAKVNETVLNAIEFGQSGHR